MDAVTAPTRPAELRTGAPGPFLPTDAPLTMPEQSLRHATAKRPAVPHRPKALWLRRAFILLVTIAMTAFAAHQMYQVLAVTTLTISREVASLCCFIVLLFAWTAFSFASALVGFALSLGAPDKILGLDPNSALPVLTARHALLVPTYNESPARVLARLQAIYEQVTEAGRLGAHFEFLHPKRHHRSGDLAALKEGATFRPAQADPEPTDILPPSQQEHRTEVWKYWRMDHPLRRWLPGDGDPRRRQPDDRRYHRPDQRRA